MSDEDKNVAWRRFRGRCMPGFTQCVFCLTKNIYQKRTECPKVELQLLPVEERDHSKWKDLYYLCIAYACNLKLCASWNEHSTDLILWLVPVFQIPVPQDHLKNKRDTSTVSLMSSCVCARQRRWDTLYMEGAQALTYAPLSADWLMTFQWGAPAGQQLAAAC